MISLIGFIIAISILVVIHEFGHYIVARLCKVKVLVFSVGFGPKLIQFKTKHNQWQISAIPLGGYVKMLDEREGNVSPQDKHLAYNNKHPLQKILIAFAGPLFNILFAYGALSYLAYHGVQQLKPIIASVNLSSLIEIDNNETIKPNSQILAINNSKVENWQNANKLFEQNITGAKPLIMQLKHESTLYQLTLHSKQNNSSNNQLSLIETGLYPFIYTTKISNVEPDSPAKLAGLKSDDIITKVDNQVIDNWFQLSKIIHDNPGKKITIDYKRNNITAQTAIIPQTITNEKGQIFGKLGIMPSLDEKMFQENTFIHKYNLIQSFKFGFISCYDIVFANLKIITNMVMGDIPLNNLGGPVTIAKASGEALNHGATSFIQLLALLSLSIAIMNLLPIPVLDGGHIVIYSIEWIIGRQINKETQYIIFTIGLIALLSIMAIAFLNDFTKLLN